MIPKDTVDAIMQATVIEEVVGEFVQLKKSGTSMRGLSPFTNEKTPSFYVVPGKGIFKDFSSGKGGSAVTFLMEHEKLSYPEALRWLANKYGIEVEERQLTQEEQAEQTERESLANLATWAQKWFTEQLMRNRGGQERRPGVLPPTGLRRCHLVRFCHRLLPGHPVGPGRRPRPGGPEGGLSGEVAAVERALQEARGRHTLRFLPRPGDVPDSGRDGRFIGFGGRTLKTDKKVPKYVNSPESPLYDKSRALYGIHLARNAIVRADRAILVEGYTDVMAMRQAGVEQVVASSGTALTVEQVRLLRRFSKNITMLFDGDPAGLRAAIRGVDIVLGEGLDVKVAVLPDGEDPDTFAKRMGQEELMAWLEENSQDFIRFKIDLLDEEAQGDPVKRAEMVRSVVQSIARCPTSSSGPSMCRRVPADSACRSMTCLGTWPPSRTSRKRPRHRCPPPSAEVDAPFSVPTSDWPKGGPGGREVDLLRLLVAVRPTQGHGGGATKGSSRGDRRERGWKKASPHPLRSRSPWPRFMMHELDNMAVAIRNPWWTGWWSTCAKKWAKAAFPAEDFASSETEVA